MDDVGLKWQPNHGVWHGDCQRRHRRLPGAACDGQSVQFYTADGKVKFEEGTLKSSACDLAGGDRCGPARDDLNPKLPVNPPTSVVWRVKGLPVIGRILPETRMAMGVQGPKDGKPVVPLSPDAVGARVGGILRWRLRRGFASSNSGAPAPRPIAPLASQPHKPRAS